MKSKYENQRTSVDESDNAKSHKWKKILRVCTSPLCFISLNIDKFAFLPPTPPAPLSLSLSLSLSLFLQFPLSIWNWKLLFNAGPNHCKNNHTEMLLSFAYQSSKLLFLPHPLPDWGPLSHMLFLPHISSRAFNPNPKPLFLHSPLSPWAYLFSCCFCLAFSHYTLTIVAPEILLSGIVVFSRTICTQVSKVTWRYVFSSVSLFLCLSIFLFVFLPVSNIDQVQVQVYFFHST